MKNNIVDGYYGMRTLILPSSVILIGSNAFVNCYALKYIILTDQQNNGIIILAKKTFGIPYKNMVTIQPLTLQSSQ